MATSSSLCRAREGAVLNEELFILRELQAILRFFLDVGAGRFSSAINHVAGLPFLPLAGRTPSSSAALLRQLPLVVDRLLAPLVLGILHCIDCLPTSDMSLQNLKSNVSASRVSLLDLYSLTFI